MIRSSNQHIQSTGRYFGQTERFRIDVGLCTDIWTFATQSIRPKTDDAIYVTTTWIICDAFLTIFWHSSRTNVTKLAFQHKLKKMAFCLCTVWKKLNFDQSTTEQRASKKSKNTIFDFTLLRTVYEFDRGQPRLGLDTEGPKVVPAIREQSLINF